MQSLIDGRTWAEFCDALKQAGDVVLAEGTPNDPLTRAEGFRYLTRLLRAALETTVEASDPLAPEFRRTAHETIKMGLDNPDNVYLNAPIHGRHRYRLTGTRGSVHYLGFGTQKGGYGATGNLETTGYLEAADLSISPDGKFEILVAAERPAEHRGNWLPMEAESRMLVVRQTRLDHANEEPATLSLERIDGAHRPRALDPLRVQSSLRAATQFVHGCSKLFDSWSREFQTRPNRLPRFDPARAQIAGGDPNIAYYHGYWTLAKDEALVVEAAPPKCDYWNFQLANHWLESLDYRYFPVHVNSHTARLRDDGSVRVVVSARNPGVENWLDPCGHRSGTMSWRWIRASETPEPSVRVVPLADLERG